MSIAAGIRSTGRRRSTTQPPDTEEAQARRARFSTPLAYGLHTSRGRYHYARHIEIISDAFWRCATTPNGRLLVLAPIRHSKSETVSHAGVCWYLTTWPDRWVNLGSHGARLAESWGQRNRDTVFEHGAPFGVLPGPRQAIAEWSTTLGGGMRSHGFDGPVTGTGAHLIVVDDATKGKEAALSPTQQADIWGRWIADVSTRRMPPSGSFGGTSIVIINTPWAEGDFVSRLLRAYEQGPSAQGYEDWEILFLPALYDGKDWTGRRPYVDPLGRQLGEALWPEAWPVSYLEGERKRLQWWFGALNMCRPEPVEGGLLKEHAWGYWTIGAGQEAWHEPVDVVVASELFKRQPRQLPKLTRVLLSVDANFAADLIDLAAGRERSDAAIQAWGLDAEGNKYLLDRHASVLDVDGTVTIALGMRQRLTPGSEVAQALGLELPAPVAFVEAKAMGPSVLATLRRKGVPCLPVTPLGSKVGRVVGAGATEHERMGRAASFADEQAAGKCYLPHPALIAGGYTYEWVAELRRRFASFPASGKDDTDAASQAWAKLALTEWSAEESAAIQAADAARKMLQYAGLPQDVPVPTTVEELVFRRRDEAMRMREREMIERQRGGPVRRGLSFRRR